MSAKSQSLAAEIRDALAKRFSTISALSFDSDGEPYLLIGAGTAGSQSAIVKVKGLAPLGTDALGLSPRSYSPCIVQVVLETSTIANVALMTEINELALLGELAHRGAQIQLYMSANANAVDVSDISAGNLKATFDPDLKYKTMSSI